MTNDQKKFRSTKGFLMIQVLVFGGVALVVIGGLIAFAAANIRLGQRIVRSEQAFQMAEAGLEYYRWHLAHAPGDYTDGTGNPGPYEKEFYDKDGNLLGTFSLDIIAPPPGSTLVEIISTGISEEDQDARRSILSRLAIPSFGNFAVAANDFMRFGEGTEVFGPIHSNDGIRFDGLAHNIVTSALTSFDDPGHDDPGSEKHEFGVHTHVNPPPGSGVSSSGLSSERSTNPVPARPDVFVAGRSFPAPEVQFSNITADVEQIKEDAEDGGLYFGESGYEGYRVVLKINGSFDLYRVNSVRSSCGSPSWSINSTTFLGNYEFPENGLMFFDDHIWVEGQIDEARITIAAADIPSSGSWWNPSEPKSITINNDLLYINYDGTDVIALIAEDDINVGLYSEDDLRIDAALIAKNGRVGRHSYSSPSCGSNRFKDMITLYGTIITNEQYGFTWTGNNNYNCGGGLWISSGYCNRNIIYDAFLLYSPPPYFPETEDFHEVIFWKEL